MWEYMGAFVYIRKLTVQKSKAESLDLTLKVTVICTLDMILLSILKVRICQISNTCSKSGKIIIAFDTEIFLKLFFANSMPFLLSKKYKSFKILDCPKE